MEKEKQIDEMAKLLHLNYDMPYEFSKGLAEFLIDEGYAKASEVAREIFAEILEIMNGVYSSVQYGCYSYGTTKQTDSPSAQRQCGKLEGVKYIGDRLAELKKKYTQGKEEIPPYVRMDVKALPAILKVKYTEDGE